MSLLFVVATGVLLLLIFVITPGLVYVDGARIGLENPRRFAILTLVTGGVGVALYLLERERRTFETAGIS